jgi:hypothetical protein
MTYLGEPRLIFSGRFQANISTVNNIAAHFDNAGFKQDFQKMGADGLFNPQGDAAFRLLGCGIEGAWSASGRVAADDPLLKCLITDGDGAVCGKLVDLDTQQQLVSQIWGLQVRITDPDGVTLMRGDFEPAAFMDIWDRALGGSGGDVGGSAAYHSTLGNLVWGDVSHLPLLGELRDATDDDRLSIKFVVDGFNLDFTSPQFMTGRIVGAIGAAKRGEPHHMVLGRQFMADATADQPRGNFFTPAGAINFFPGRIDAAAKKLYLDLGNALPSTVPGGPMADLGDLAITVAGLAAPLGLVKSGGPDGYASDPRWCEKSAGIVAFDLTNDQLTKASAAPLSVTGNASVAIAEAPNGAFVRADAFVYRMSPGERATARVYATRFGRPLSGAAIAVASDPAQLQGSTDPSQELPVATPAQALAFDASVTTDADGVAAIGFVASDPGSPRWFNNGADYGIDGQIYGVRPAFADPALAAGIVNQWNFVSFLVWSGFTPANPITWSQIQPVLQQYANLYPVMNRFLDLGDPAAVKANARLLKLGFGLDPTDPNAMPVTRDLSPAKRAAILQWLDNPVEGPAHPAGARASTSAARPAQTASPPPGGKAAAAARRAFLR